MSAKESMEMEVDNPSSSDAIKNPSDSDKSVMAGGAVGSVTCSLHPLVIMNVSEHWTREKAQEGSIQRGTYQNPGFTSNHT